MASLLLTGSHLKKVSEITAFLGGLQAQDFAGAKWSIALRSTGLTEADVDAAVSKRQIVRT